MPMAKNVVANLDQLPVFNTYYLCLLLAALVKRKTRLDTFSAKLEQKRIFYQFEWEQNKTTRRMSLFTVYCIQIIL